MAVHVPEMCFWPAHTKTKLEFFEVLTCLWPGAQIFFRHKWKKMATVSLLLPCIPGDSCLNSWNEFFYSVFQVLNQSFLVFQCHANVCNWNPKLIWKRLDYFWSFLLEYAPFCQPNICMDWSLQELVNYSSFLTTSKFFDSSFDGYSDLFSKYAYACTF